MSIEIIELSSLNENNIRRTLVGDKIVSTIYRDLETQSMDSVIGLISDILGEDIGRPDLNQPGNFETMVFDGNIDGVTSWEEKDFRRYYTEDEAIISHQKMIDKWAKMPGNL